MSVWATLCFWLIAFILMQFVFPNLAEHPLRGFVTYIYAAFMMFLPPLMGTLLLILGRQGGYFLVFPYATILIVVSLIDLYTLQNSGALYFDSTMRMLFAIVIVALVSHVFCFALRLPLAEILVPKKKFRLASLTATLLWAFFAVVNIVESWLDFDLLEHSGTFAPSWFVCIFAIATIRDAQRWHVSGRLLLALFLITPLRMMNDGIFLREENWLLQLLWLPVFAAFTIVNLVLIVARPDCEREVESVANTNTADATP